MTYEELLANAPKQDTPEFIDYLREHNRVVHENKNWIVIENFKYHSKERPWHTAFHKEGKLTFKELSRIYYDWEWLKKAKKHQSVPQRFHIHFHRGDIIET